MKSVFIGLALCIVPQCVVSQQKPATNSVEVSGGVSIVLPAPWSLASRATNAIEVVYPLSGKPAAAARAPSDSESEETFQPPTADAHITILVEKRENHAEALDRLAEIASEEPGRPEMLAIADWPAIHRQFTAPLPQTGEKDSPYPVETVFTTTAIAAGEQIIRFDTVLAPGADAKLAEAAFHIAREVQVAHGNPDEAQRDLKTLERQIPEEKSSAKDKGESEGRTRPDSGDFSGAGTALVQPGNGELEVVISSDGLHVVVAANSGYGYSDNGGTSFTHVGKTPCIYKSCDGDPSLAIGKSGRVYYSWIGFPTNAKTDSLSVSKNNGHSFAFLSNAVVCPAATPNVCTTPDQEHIAADRNAYSKLKQDRVYLTWRNFASGVSTSPKIVCSADGGTTWSAQTVVGTGDFPRITVGGDSFVYVIYRSGSTINLNKFSPCDSGLLPQAGFPRKIANYSPVVCPVPGLDRCNNGNTLSSHMVAVDDTNTSHVFVAFASNTGAGNDDILVYDSVNGGKSWSSQVKVNKAVNAVRFMPWICAAGGVASVSWYDRRAADKAHDDLTAYYRGSVQRLASPNVLQVNPEVDVSQVNDPQCASGWPGGERSAADATSCSTPQLAGKCLLPCAATKPPSCTGSTGTGTPCDLTKPTSCGAPETCQRWGRGSPKYGDYNGNACTPGINGIETPNVCTAWASATPPKGVATEKKGIQVYAVCTPMTGAPVTITYHQVGACNGYNGSYGLVEAGYKQAYVDFGIESIDNSLGTVAFDFDPKNLYVEPKLANHFDPSLQFYTDILGSKAAVPLKVPAGVDHKFSPSVQGAAVVQTSNPDGAVEADATAYALGYNRQPGDPLVKLVKSDAKQTSWPLTRDCKTMTLH